MNFFSMQLGIHSKGETRVFWTKPTIWLFWPTASGLNRQLAILGKQMRRQSDKRAQSSLYLTHHARGSFFSVGNENSVDPTELDNSSVLNWKVNII